MSYEKYTVKVYSNEDKLWYNQDDQLHRLDGPACEYSDGSKYWFQNDQLHRLDGPASEYPDGSKYWFQNGQRHRLDGPAIEYSNGDKSWYIEGKYYTEDDFNTQVNPPDDCLLNKTVIIDGKEYHFAPKNN